MVLLEGALAFPGMYTEKEIKQGCSSTWGVHDLLRVRVVWVKQSSRKQVNVLAMVVAKEGIFVSRKYIGNSVLNPSISKYSRNDSLRSLNENIKCKAYFAEFGQSECVYFTITETSDQQVF